MHLPDRRCAARIVSTGTVAAGLGLALWLSLLRTNPPGCGGSSGCAQVLSSKFSVFLGLPITWWASGLWVCAILINNQHFRVLLLGLFATASCILVGIQVLYIHTLCPYCLVHAILTWLAYFYRDHKPTIAILPAAVLAAIIFWLGVLHFTVPSKSIEIGALRPVLADSAFYWLGKRTPESPVIILDLRCQACLGVLRKLASSKNTASPPPGIIFRTNDDSDLTVSLVAAILSHRDGPEMGFRALTKEFLHYYDAIMAEEEGRRGLATSLLLLKSVSHVTIAQERLTSQRMLLNKLGIIYTPTYVEPNGNVSYLTDPIAGHPNL